MIKTLKIDIDQFMKIDEMEFNKLMILIGTNGSGKSVVLKLNYFIMTFLSVLQQSIDNIDTNVDEIHKIANEIFNGVFDNFDITGSIEMSTDKDQRIKFVFDKGDVKVDYFDNSLLLENIPRVLYMSTNARLFSYLKMYLKDYLQHQNNLHAIVQNKENLSTEEFSEQITNELRSFQSEYKLFDHSYALMWILQEEITMTTELKSRFKKFDENLFKDMFDKIVIDLDKKDIIVHYNDEKKPSKSLTTFSNGEQAIINMIISSYLANLSS